MKGNVYSVREIRLLDVIHQAIAENKYLLLQNGVRIGLEKMEGGHSMEERYYAEEDLSMEERHHYRKDEAELT